MKVVGAESSLFLFEEVDHVLNYFWGILVDDPDHHPAQNRVDMGVDIVQLLSVLVLHCLL